MNRQLEILIGQERFEQLERYRDSWKAVDDVFVNHPELAELWLTSEQLQLMSKKFPDAQDRQRYLRRRAGASFIFSAYFRNFRLEKSIVESTGALPFDLAAVDGFNDEIRNMWFDGAIRSDYDRYPAFVDLIDGWMGKSPQAKD